jgi:hypothetical protein
MGTKYTGTVTWLIPRRDGKMWGGTEKTPYVNKYTFCAPTRYREESYSICLEWDEQPEEDVPIRVDIFALVRWAPEDLVQRGKTLILYQGATPVAEVKIDN